MKKLITFLSITLALNTSITLAQTKPLTTPPHKTTEKESAKRKISKADSLICGKNWHIVAVEEWGVITKPPADINKNDMINFSFDGTYTMTMFDKPYSDTWSKSGQSITLKGVAGFFKMLVQEPEKLKLDHFSTEDGHSIFEYESK